jgi:hypothetical protein
MRANAVFRIFSSSSTSSRSIPQPRKEKKKKCDSERGAIQGNTSASENEAPRIEDQSATIREKLRKEQEERVEEENEERGQTEGARREKQAEKMQAAI